MIHSLTASELFELLKTAPETLEIIDTRSTDAFAKQHILGSRNIPLHLVPLRAADIDTKKQVIFACNSGGCSVHAILFMRKSHIECWNFDGSIVDFCEQYPEYSQSKPLYPSSFL